MGIFLRRGFQRRDKRLERELAVWWAEVYCKHSAYFVLPCSAMAFYVKSLSCSLNSLQPCIALQVICWLGCIGISNLKQVEVAEVNSFTKSIENFLIISNVFGYFPKNFL